MIDVSKHNVKRLLFSRLFREKELTDIKIIKSGETSGYTLVEVMIAVLITMVVMGGVYKTLTQETIDMEREEIILDMQNNARVAIVRIAQEVRRAGFFGCGGKLAESSVLLSNAGNSDTLVASLTSALGNDITDTWTAEQSLLNGLKANAGVDYLGTPLGLYNNAIAAHPLYDLGTDAMTLVYLGGDYPQSGTVNPADLTDTVDLFQGEFDQGDLIVVSDCKEYSLFQKTNASNTTTIEHTNAQIAFDHNGTPLAGINNTGTTLGKAYGNESQAQVFHLRASTFFINNSDLKYNLNNQTMASNIEDLQFELLFDLNSNNDISDDAWSSTIPAGFTASDARAVRIWLLAQSNIVSGYRNTDTYDYPNSPYYSAANPFASTHPNGGGAPDDNRYRYLASRWVYLRNAGI